MGHRRCGNHQFFGGGDQAAKGQGGSQGSGQQGLLHGDPCSASEPSKMANGAPNAMR